LHQGRPGLGAADVGEAHELLLEDADRWAVVQVLGDAQKQRRSGEAGLVAVALHGVEKVVLPVSEIRL